MTTKAQSAIRVTLTANGDGPRSSVATSLEGVERRRIFASEAT